MGKCFSKKKKENHPHNGGLRSLRDTLKIFERKRFAPAENEKEFALEKEKGITPSHHWIHKAWNVNIFQAFLIDTHNGI